MNDENIAKWVQDLRTTDLPQGTEFLHSVDGYCCLAIGCISAGIPENDRHFYDCQRAAPAAFVEWIGLEHAGTNYEYDIVVDWPSKWSGNSPMDSDMTLAMLNDTGFTFAQIADIIEYFGLQEAIA